jgi:cyclopropane fatty-acyl-phospholipid synthase-like methyltransferase
MFEVLEEINARPPLYGSYTAAELWTDEHISKQMLDCHLDEAVDLASWNHDLIDRSVEWLASRFPLEQGTRIVDFGCGPGLYATRLAERGAAVTGIDFSTRSIDYARGVADEKGLDICYINQDYLAFQTEQRFQLAIMVMCDFCALSPTQRRTILGTFQAILEPGGSVLMDVHSLAAFEQREETATYAPNLMGGFWSADAYYGFLNTHKYEDEKVVLDKYTIFESARTRTVYNWMQSFSPESIRTEYEDAGFEIEQLYADVAGTPYDPLATVFAVLARNA